MAPPAHSTAGASHAEHALNRPGGRGGRGVCNVRLLDTGRGLVTTVSTYLLSDRLEPRAGRESSAVGGGRGLGMRRDSNTHTHTHIMHLSYTVYLITTLLAVMTGYDAPLHTLSRVRFPGWPDLLCSLESRVKYRRLKHI